MIVQSSLNTAFTHDLTSLNFLHTKESEDYAEDVFLKAASKFNHYLFFHPIREQLNKLRPMFLLGSFQLEPMGAAGGPSAQLISCKTANNGL